MRKQREPLGRRIRKHALDHVGNPTVVVFGVGSYRQHQRFANQLVTETISGAAFGEQRLDDFRVDQSGQAGDDFGFSHTEDDGDDHRVSGSGRSRPSNEAICAMCRSPPSLSTICAKIG